MNNPIIRTTCKVSTLTPCHVGSGSTLLRNQEFVTDGAALGVIDPRKIYQILGERGIDVWCRAIENHDDIYAMLRGVRSDVRLQTICSRIIPLYGGSNRVMEMREQLRSGGVVCIPGSSIKGAIVTAILASNPMNPNLTFDNLRPLNNQVVDRFFSHSKGYDSKASSLRFLRVGDVAFEQSSTCAIHCLSLNVRSKKYSLIDEKVCQFVECVYTDDSAVCEIDLINLQSVYARDVLPYIKKIPNELTSMKDLFRCLTTHTRSLLEDELSFGQDSYTNELDDYLSQIENLISECDSCKDGHSAVLRVGYGCGWNFITGAWCRRRTELQDPDTWADILAQVRKDRMGRYREYPFIKTRRVFYNSPDVLPLGFMKIEIAQ